MSARAIGSGTISFGLVNIPIKVYSAGDSSGRVSFNQLHKKCKGRLKQQLFCPTDNEIVSRDDIVKGFEFAKEQYIVIEEQELDALDAESTKAMDISEFVPLDTVDPLYFENGYYLGPDKGAERAFKLLAVALRETKQAAVARYFNRGRENLIVLRPSGDGIVMQQLRYADELKPMSEVPLGDAEVKDAELALAKQFIQQLAAKGFEPGKYEDQYRKRLKDLIDRKVKGEEVTFAPAPVAAAPVIDLMAALKASLAKSSGEQPEALEERKPPKRAPRAEKAEKPEKRKSSKTG